MDKIGPKQALRWYLREWRDHFGLTGETVAERMNTNKGQISKIENTRQRMNDRWIIGYAEALGIEPADLLRHPDAPSIQTLLKQASPEMKERAVVVVEALLKAG